MLSRYIPKRYLFQFLQKESLQSVVDLESEIKSKAPTSINGVGVEKHYPVNYETVTKLLKENLFLKDTSDKLLLDCTVGTAGHARLLLKTFSNLHILGLDMDLRMLEFINNAARKELNEDENKRFELENKNFSHIEQVKKENYFGGKFQDKKGYDCIFADLGYNSRLQLEGKDWGLAYNLEVPLDMRYDTSLKVNAATILNEMPGLQLREILSKFGEEPSAEVITRVILKERAKKKLVTTKDLRDIIFNNFTTPSANKYKMLMRVSQAMRIAVNGEFDNLSILLEKLDNHLNPDGLAIIISFHSLEHNMVYKKISQLVIIEKKEKKIDIIEKGLASNPDEVSQNTRSRSAKLSCFRKRKSAINSV